MPWHPWSFRGCVAPSVFDFIFNAKWCSLFLPRLPIPTPWKREKDSKPVKSMKACHRTACIIHLHGKRVDKNHIKLRYWILQVQVGLLPSAFFILFLDSSYHIRFLVPLFCYLFPIAKAPDEFVTPRTGHPSSCWPHEFGPSAPLFSQDLKPLYRSSTIIIDHRIIHTFGGISIDFGCLTIAWMKVQQQYHNSHPIKHKALQEEDIQVFGGAMNSKNACCSGFSFHASLLSD